MWRPWGQHACGFVEVELPAHGGEQPVAGRIFYPASLSASAGQSGWTSWLKPWQWRRRGVPWLWHKQYARGLATFLFFRLKGRLYDAMKQLLIAFVYAVGRSQRMDLLPGAPLAPDVPDQLPLVIFSHGLGGHRFLYSAICAELASQGYCVLAVEHADGSASAALRPGGEWMLYQGLGNEQAQVAKTRVRVREMKAALSVMQALHRGDALPGLKLTDGLELGTFLKGRLDLRCVAAAGHSYGGATITALVAEDPRFACAVALDPWWYAVYPESPALRRFQTRTPLLIMGSHDWNVPNAHGQLSCGGERQEAILSAAKVRQAGESNGKEATGGGAMLLCIAGSSHNTFADVLALFGQQAGWLLERLGLSARLDPVLGMHLCTTAMLAFLSQHLPLTKQQRSVQNWEPSKRASAPRWAAIRQRDVADSREEASGPLSWAFPGRGLLLGVSDYAMDRILPRPTAFRQVGPATHALTQAPEAVLCSRQLELELNLGLELCSYEGPDDVVTSSEAAETAMPSASPASGAHPHAPGSPAGGPRLAAGLQAAHDAAAGRPMPEAQRQQLLAGLNRRYSEAVAQAEAEEMTVLLGAQHVFKCTVH
ncbi:hypothetical protein ABPG77_001253 [Micractinium sp. CCAP 211/92]